MPAGTYALLVLALSAFPLYLVGRQLWQVDRRWRAYRRQERRIKAIARVVLRYEIHQYDTDPYSGSIADYHQTIQRHKRSIIAWVETDAPVGRIADLVPAGVDATQWKSAEHLDPDALRVLAELGRKPQNQYTLTEQGEEDYFAIVYARVTGELTHMALMNSGLVTERTGARARNLETYLSQPW